MGLFEPHHLILILVIALIVFGPGKIGDLGGTLGRGLRDFKKAMHEETPPAPAPAAPAAQVREAQPVAGMVEAPAPAAADKHVA
ncbi:MAG: twin-arginine translocase TatA/TatE family subunit [Acidobacteriota bacterium]